MRFWWNVIDVTSLPSALPQRQQHPPILHHYVLTKIFGNRKFFSRDHFIWCTTVNSRQYACSTQPAPLSYLFSDTFGDLNRQIFVLEPSMSLSVYTPLLVSHRWHENEFSPCRISYLVREHIRCLFYINFLLDEITTFLHMLRSPLSCYVVDGDGCRREWGWKRRIRIDFSAHHIYHFHIHNRNRRLITELLGCSEMNIRNHIQLWRCAIVHRWLLHFSCC